MVKAQHGGKRKGSGRRPLPFEAKQRNRFALALTDAEAEALMAAAEAARTPPATYARDVLVRHLKRKG